jgi:outer membrane scaffolding protein for murein synthesis (MipA/OmpV family)
MRFASVAFAAAFIAVPAFAQTGPGPLPSPEEVRARDSFTVALGAGLSPDYEGSNDYRLIPAAAIRGKVGGISFNTRGLYLYVDVIPDRGSGVNFDFGPVVGARLNRTRKIHDDIVDLLPDRNTAIEVGAFGGISVSGLTNPYDSLAFNVTAVHDVASAHESTVVSPQVSFSTPLSRTTYASASVGMNFVSDKFADYYFSITPADRLATGNVLPVFDADGGMKDWNASLLLNQSLSGDLLHGFSIFGTGQYSRLVGDFKRSPIVDDRGSANQWLVAAGLAYSW